MAIDKREEFKKRYDEFDSQLPQHCQNCGSIKGLTIHHVVPLAVGGNNVIGNMVRLCEDCHSNVHGEKILNKELQRKGIERAKKAGKFKGMPKKYTTDHEGVQKALELYHNRKSYKPKLTVDKIAEQTGIPRATIYRIIKAQKENA